RIRYTYLRERYVGSAFRRICGFRDKKRPLPIVGSGPVRPETEMSVVDGDIEPREPRRQDRVRVQPRSAVRLRVAVTRLVAERVIAVEQVIQVDADIGPCAAEPQHLRK